MKEFALIAWGEWLIVGIGACLPWQWPSTAWVVPEAWSLQCLWAQLSAGMEPLAGANSFFHWLRYSAQGHATAHFPASRPGNYTNWLAAYMQALRSSPLITILDSPSLKRDTCSYSACIFARHMPLHPIILQLSLLNPQQQPWAQPLTSALLRNWLGGRYLATFLTQFQTIWARNFFACGNVRLCSGPPERKVLSLARRPLLEESEYHSHFSSGLEGQLWSFQDKESLL